MSWGNIAFSLSPPMGAMCKIIGQEMNYLSVVVSYGRVLTRHIIILRFDRNVQSFPLVFIRLLPCVHSSATTFLIEILMEINEYE